MAIESGIAKLICSLDDSQISLVEEYHCLQTSSFLSDEVCDRLCNIWELAQTDLALCKLLELIDDLVCEPTEPIDVHEFDRRAYWAEYLVSELQEYIVRQSKEDDSF